MKERALIDGRIRQSRQADNRTRGMTLHEMQCRHPRKIEAMLPCELALTLLALQFKDEGRETAIRVS